MAVFFFLLPHNNTTRNRKERSKQSAKDYFLERSAAYFDELKSTAASAPREQIFDHAEAFAVLQGRELIRQALATALQEQIDDFEKKGNAPLSEMPKEKTTRRLSTKRTNLYCRKGNV